MKKKKPQSQSQSHRKNIPKSPYQPSSILKKNHTNIINTFRQTKEKEPNIPSSQIKKNLNKTNKESPKTIDYRQVMNKYSHLIEQNHTQNTSSKNIEGKKYYNCNNYFIETDYNQDKKETVNILPYNPYNSSGNNPKEIKVNNNDNFFQFCRTDYENEEDKNNFKYYTLKNFYMKKKSGSEIYNYNNLENTSKNNNNNVDNNKINNILMSYNRNIKPKNRENVFNNEKNKINDNNLHKSSNNKIFSNSNIHNNVSLRKISKKNSSNSHSLNNININKTNKYFNINNNENKNHFSNISLFKELLTQQNNKSHNNFPPDFFSEKIYSFINLCQKYAKNLSNCINFVEINHNTIFNNNDYLDELKYIINQYNKFVFSEKINDYFNIKNNQIKYIDNYNLSEFEPKTLNLTERFRNKIKDLKSEKSEINNELILYKKKNRSLTLEKEELNLINKQLMKENEELKKKIDNLMNFENKCYHQNNMIDKLKCQIETLNIDIRYKENIINNLQQILEQIKIKSNLMNYNNNTNDSDNIKSNINKNNNPTLNTKKTSLKELGNEYIIKGINNTSDFLLDVNSESIEKDIIIPLNLKVNSIEGIKKEEYNVKKKEDESEIIINNKDESEKNIMKLIQNLKVKNNNQSKSKLLYSEIDEPEILTKEMEKIDQDILNLKTKLKKIISK